MPTISELRSLIRGCPATQTGGTCGVTDTCLAGSCFGPNCYGCNYLQGPGGGGCYWDAALDGTCSYYWSSSSYAGSTTGAWAVVFTGGGVADDTKTNADSVRCVRDGS